MLMEYTAREAGHKHDRSHVEDDGDFDPAIVVAQRLRLEPHLARLVCSLSGIGNPQSRRG
jgi:hypothetical protein